MKNQLIDDRTKRDIEERVSRLHRDIGHRGGKIELVNLRTMLKLDLAYYSAKEPNILSEVVHKVKVGANK